jgi:transcriptional regulator with XRE-family HTH domain
MRERRIELGLSQLELGEAMGCGQEAVSQLEKHGPRKLESVERIAAALEVTPWWLAWGVPCKATDSEDDE